MNDSNKEEINKIVKSLNTDKPKFIVGIGASAGGLNALNELFENLPNDTGAAFVVVQHLSPDFKTIMDELLQRHTKMPVESLHDLHELKPNHVYVLPERRNITLSGGKIILSDAQSSHAHHPIDTFFKSIASVYQQHAVGIVMSGTGNDGAKGIEELHSVGALTMAQSPDDAEFDGMPIAAIDTGKINVQMAAEKMGEAICDYIFTLEFDECNSKEDEEEYRKVLAKIYEQIDKHTEISISPYKQSTVERRIQHRMGVLGIRRVAEYLAYLLDNKTEKESLAKDMLIGVTQFFRDPEVWAIISEKVIKHFILRKNENDPIRVWVPGCSTGEEAYSISILFTEALKELKEKREVKIFASDVDVRSVSKASSGLYSHNIVSEVPKDLLNKYFIHTRDGYVVNDEIKQKVVFATHNVVEDPPFSNMDFISCRNLLIYFQSNAQNKILSYFHFSLNADGKLLLGTAENCSSMKTGFEQVESGVRLFTRVNDTKISLSQLGLKKGLMRRIPTQTTRTIQPTFSMAGDSQYSIMSKVKEELFNEQISPTIVIDSNENVVFSFGNTENLTRKLSEGSFSAHYSSILDNSLVSLVASMIKQVNTSKKTVLMTHVKLSQGANLYSVSCKYRELAHGVVKGHYVLQFKEMEVIETTDDEGETSHSEKLKDKRIDELNVELLDARELIGRKQQDVEALSEELQCINEELMASNEELQSTNEELQSVNEELFTVNSEYQEKIQELENANQDLDFLLRSTDVGVVFLDPSLMIRRFTAQAQHYANLLPMDINRPFSDISLKFDQPDFHGWVDNALNSGRSERRRIELKSHPHNVVFCTIYPQLDRDNNVTGLIISFQDLTELISEIESVE